MQIALLEQQSLTQLQKMWEKYFDTPPISKNKEFYISRLAYRIQELAYGGLSSHQQQVIANMHVPSRSHNNLPPTGTRIVREYLGVDHVVVVLPDGFEFNGCQKILMRPTRLMKSVMKVPANSTANISECSAHRQKQTSTR